ncbi:hypothetical protein L9F63_020875, partial [Diploptera punctata]
CVQRGACSEVAEQHGGVVVSFASLRNNLRRTMASRSPASSCPLFLRHLDLKIAYQEMTILGNGFQNSTVSLRQ